VVFGAVLLLVGIAAGRAVHAWAKVMLVILEVVFEGVVLLSLFGEIWFLAKTAMTVGMTAVPALVLAIVAGLALTPPAVWLVQLVVAKGYARVGREEQFRSDVRGSLWLARNYTFRPRDFLQ